MNKIKSLKLKKKKNLLERVHQAENAIFLEHIIIYSSIFITVQYNIIYNVKNLSSTCTEYLDHF
jgi:hypothetical protein